MTNFRCHPEIFVGNSVFQRLGMLVARWSLTMITNNPHTVSNLLRPIIMITRINSFVWSLYTHHQVWRQLYVRTVGIFHIKMKFLCRVHLFKITFYLFLIYGFWIILQYFFHFLLIVGKNGDVFIYFADHDASDSTHFSYE